MHDTDKAVEAMLDEVRLEYRSRITQGSVSLLSGVGEYLASRNGKMLRPRMTLEAAATLGADNLHSHRTLLLATCVEMLHNASLLHDDVVDKADKRRGRPSVNAQWNNAVAVLVGDFFFAQIMQLLDEVDDRGASRLLNNCTKAMTEAELLQQEIMAGKPLTESDYLTIIDGKTANLFATACAFGNPTYRDLGLHYGRMFQIHDDISDGEAPQFANRLLEAERQQTESLHNAGILLPMTQASV